VFSGEVVDIGEGPPIRMMGSRLPSSRATLRVSEVWKGPEQETLEVSTPVSGSACGYPFKEGQEYLVYADGKQELKVDICSETKPLSKAGVNLQALRNSQRPKDGAPLSDTSGGISVGMMAGVAGLGMAASFLLIVRLVHGD
jgi:hypothetical protein